MSLSGVSLFSSAGLAECYLSEVGVQILVANELLKERAKLYQSQHPHAKMICGDILNEQIFAQILKETPANLDFLLASPPCQGMSVAGKNRNQKQMQADARNMLIFRVLDFIKIKKPRYILIENVPNFLRLKFEFKGRNSTIAEILQSEFKDYVIEAGIFDAADFGVAQVRKRAIVKMYKKGLKWQNPTKERQKSVFQAIGDLPSLEAGEVSSLKWHFARKHSQNHIECLKHTKTGESALNNPIFYPTNKGKKVKTTANKLLGINTARLKEHRDEIGGAYTIIITSRYVPAAKRDIAASQNVLLLATTFAEYLYNCISSDIREIDYGEFDEIIARNLGKDISGEISNLSLAKFGLAQ